MKSLMNVGLVMIATVPAMADGSRFRPMPNLQVGFFNYAEVSDGVLTKAQDTVNLIFRRAGVQIAWARCPVSDEESLSAACEAAPVYVKFISRSMARVLSLRPTVLGLAPRDERTGYGSVAYVLIHRVRKLARNADISLPDLLGHVLAHELGHVLLRERGHKGFSLMSGDWEPYRLRLAQRRALGFSKDQSDEMRARIRVLTASRPASEPVLSSSN
jgi:hypothetical protein